MNSVSSRSHAIFSVVLKQKVSNASNDDVVNKQDQTVPSTESNNNNTIVSKFHFVDLAGSERVSKNIQHFKFNK